MPSTPPSRQWRAAVAYPSSMASISAMVSARGSAMYRGEGTAEGATVGARGADEICSRPPWKSCTNSFVPCSCSAAASRS